MRCLGLLAVTMAVSLSCSVAGAQPAESVVATDSGLAARLADAREQLLTKDHPLVPVLRYAYEGYDRIDRDVHDYTCLLIKRERVDGKLGPYQHIEAKIRHPRSTENGDVPFAVFLRFLGPAEWKDREVLFVNGQHNGDLIARRGGKRSPNMTLRLEPTSPLAMDGNRYPITEIGIQNLIARLIEVGEQEIQYAECEEVF